MKIVIFLLQLLSITSVVYGMDKSITTEDTKKDPKRASLPPLDLSARNLGQYIPDTTLQTPLRSADDFHHIAAAAATYRGQTHRGKGLGTNTDVTIDVNDPNHSPFITAGSGSPIQSFEHAAWAIWEQANPLLYRFAQEHKKSSEEMVIYAKLWNKFKMEPKAMIEYVKQHTTADDRKAHGWQIDEFDQIKKEDPEKYGALVLEVIDAFLSKESGQKGGAQMPKVTGELVNVLEKKVDTQGGTINKQWVAIVAKFILLVGSVTWALYGQIHGAHNGTATG